MPFKAANHSIEATAHGKPLSAPHVKSYLQEILKKMHMFGETETVKFGYAVRMSGIVAGGKPKYASQCVECGECLDKCPQHIPIPEFLAKVAAEMERERRGLATCAAYPDGMEGWGAFSEKRKPLFNFR